MRRTSLWIVASAAAALAASPALAQNAAGGADAGGGGTGTVAATNGNGANGAAGANGAGARQANNNVGGALVALSPSAVRQVQQVLNRLGYFAGPLNGVWDTRSAVAMAHFQEAHGLEPTGNVNFSTIAGLGLWNNLIGDPLGNNHKSLEASNASTNGAPPQRGNGKTTVAGEPLPSQRITTTGGNALGSNTSMSTGANGGGGANATAK